MATREGIQSNTANPNEISHFESISSEWWDEKGAFRMLYSLNEIRVSWILDGLKDTGIISKESTENPRPLEGLHILDVGCGGGLLSEPLARLGCTIVGVDLSEHSIEVAKAHASQDPSLTNLTYFYESIDYHAEKNFEKYDIVIAAEVVDHVDQPEEFLKMCAKCLKPGGTIFVSTINRTMFSWLFAIIGAEYILGWVPRGTHHYNNFITPEELGMMLKKCNCQMKKVEGSLFNPITGNWSRTNMFLKIAYGVYGVKDK